jgi:hypothetical protein
MGRQRRAFQGVLGNPANHPINEIWLILNGEIFLFNPMQWDYPKEKPSCVKYPKFRIKQEIS